MSLYYIAECVKYDLWVKVAPYCLMGHLHTE